jgi:muramoyltetrapeptide carboxypeptidase
MVDNFYKKWQKLQVGDIVDIVAPACGCTSDEIKMSVSVIESLGLKARIAEDIVDDQAFILCANSDKYRLAQMKDALTNNISKAVWCLRGGYGCARIIEELSKCKKPKKAKLFIGFSDITAIHLILNQQWKWATLHAPVLFQCGKNLVTKESQDSIKEIIFGNCDKAEFNNIEPLNAYAREDMSIYSSIVGGNLSLLQTSIGTSWHISGKNNIIFIEEVGERGYAVDRMLVHLKQAGIFDEAKAVIFGDFTGGVEADNISLNDMVINKFSNDIEIPVLKLQGVGHDKTNLALPLGSQAILRLGSNSSLICNSGAS